jgi:SAM-dependent methyltransferase
MRKLNFGCGGNIIGGWENHDIDVDITKPLPYDNDSIDFIFAEHVVEHTDSPTALRFFDECYRILKTGGVVRIAVPSITEIYANADQQYLDWLGGSGFGDPTLISAVRTIVLNHGHLSCWNNEILNAMLFAAGFKSMEPRIVGSSAHPDLKGVEGHGNVIGHYINSLETIVMEATK